MKRKFLANALLLLVFHPAISQTISENLARLEKSFLQEPSVYQNYENLEFLLNTKYEQLSGEQRRRIRMLLDRSNFSTVTAYSPEEVGTRIVIKGKVTDENGNAIPSAKITFFQADSRGYYAPADAQTKRMSESDARLFGVLRTGADGAYVLRAIKPASYPIQYEGRFIPAHIHFNIEAKGHAELKLQVVFDDDPPMEDDHWRKWAKEQKFPVLKLRVVNGANTGICNIVLR